MCDWTEIKFVPQILGSRQQHEIRPTSKCAEQFRRRMEHARFILYGLFEQTVA